MERFRLALVARAKNERGFTLLEIIVAFSLITLLALFTLPLMATGLQYTSISATTASANSRVQQAVEQARISPITCASLTALVGTNTYSDGRGNQYRIVVSLPSGYTSNVNAQTVPLRVTATRVKGSIVLTNLTTRILVPGTTP